MIRRIAFLLALLAAPAFAAEYRPASALPGAVSLSGSPCTTNVIAKWNGTQTLGCSSLTDDGTAVTSTAPLLLPSGTAAAPSWGWSSDADGSGTGFYRGGANLINITINGADRAQFGASRLNLGSDAGIAWGNSALIPNVGAYDTILTRISAGVVGVNTGVALGTNPAQSGAVRLANNTLITARNAANSADVTIATVNASDQPIFGAGITATGTTCTITAITGGIITAGSCL